MNNTEKYLGFNDKWLLLFGIPFVTILVTILIHGIEIFTQNPTMALAIGFVFTSAYWFSYRYFITSYHKRFSGYIFDWKRLRYVVIRVVLIYFLVRVVLGSIVHYFFPHSALIEKAHSIEASLSTCMVILLVFFIYEGIYYFNKSRLIDIKNKTLEKITAEQKLSTLKDQVNPHFLFNSLNTLVSIIPEEPQMAIEFVQNLSQTYRGILEVRNEKLITIRKELEGLESYLFLLKTRFQGKIQIFNSIEESAMDHFILPLSLQILIENAVKHNVTSKAKPLEIKLSKEDNFIIVKNVFQPKSQNYSSTKLGLQNIKSRYKLLTNKNVIVISNDDYFIVKLPIIKHTLI